MQRGFTGIRRGVDVYARLDAEFDRLDRVLLGSLIEEGAAGLPSRQPSPAASMSAVA